MIKKIVNKKGSHVGVVVSFVIFVTFLIFLYTILQPATVRERDRQYILDYLTLNIIGNSSGEISTLIINVIESTGAKNCINMQTIYPYIEGYENNLLIKNDSNFILSYSFNPSTDVWIETGEDFTGILKVYSGDEVVRSPESDATGCLPRLSSTGYVKSYSEIFESKIEDLNETYYADYEGLKVELGLSEGTEFNFYILDSLRNVIISAEIQPPPTDRSVYVEETPIQYIDKNGNTLFGFLVVKIWQQ